LVTFAVIQEIAGICRHTRFDGNGKNGYAQRARQTHIETMMMTDDVTPPETPGAADEPLFDKPLDEGHPTARSGSRAARRASAGSQGRWAISSLAVAGLVLILLLIGSTAYLLIQPQSVPLLQAATATPAPLIAIVTSAPSPTTPVLSAEGIDQLLAQAQDLTNKSQFEEAIALYQQLVAQAPEDWRPEAGWAQALLLDLQGEEGLKHARRAMELDPVSAEALAGLAQAYIQVGDREHALAMAQSALEIDTMSAQAHIALADAYRLDGQLDMAVKEAELAVSLSPSSAEAHCIRGWLYALADGDPARAASELAIAAQLQPEVWLWHHDHGTWLLQAGQYEEAIVALKSALALQPKAQTYTALGQAYYGLGEYDRAESNAELALSSGAGDADTFALLAAIQARLGHCADAQTYLEQVLPQAPQQPLAMEAQAACQLVLPTATPTRAPTQTPVPKLTGQIAFPVWNTSTSKYDTYVIKANGSDRQLVVEEMHQPAFRPDGQWLAVNGERAEHMNLFIVRPDGNSLAFSSTRQRDRQARIYVIDQVPFVGDKADGRTLYSGMYEVFGDYPEWSDEGRILYAGCDYTSNPVRCGLFAIGAQPSSQTSQLLTNHPSDTAPAVCGELLAFMSNRDGNWELYTVSEDGGEPKRLTYDPANDGLPTWSPDCSTLAFVSDRGGTWAVWAVKPDGTEHRKLFDIGGGGLASNWQSERISWAH
jgi:tetratricopeptide (TPR) repeat protein